jgi:exodeoxyribonuclease VII large subunit
MLQILQRRAPGIRILVRGVRVQGTGAAQEIAGAVAAFSAEKNIDLLVVARGGGSLEDLWAFNEEAVARALAACPVPTISAVGHETDFTIADFVADLRAPTPSAAAELITAAQHQIAERVENLVRRLDRAANFQLLQARQRLTRLPVARSEARMSTLLHRSAQRLDDLSLRLEAAMATQLRQQQGHVARLAAAVLHHNPRQSIAHARERLQAGHTRIQRSIERTMQRSVVRLGALDARLNSLSPLAVLDRGYALVLTPDGALVRSTTQLAPGDKVRTRLADGDFTSSVESIGTGKSAHPKPNPRKQRKN